MSLEHERTHMSDEREDADWNDATEGESGSLAWKTIASDTVYTCPGFSIRNETVRLPDGTETDFDYLTEPPAVVVLPLTSDREVVLIEEWRQAVRRVNRGVPAGTVECEDGDLEAAARRELREETGYEADRMTHLTSVEPLNGAADSVHHYFLAEGCAPTGGRDLDADESIRSVEESYEAFRESVRAGEVRDGRAVLALSFYELLDDR